MAEPWWGSRVELHRILGSGVLVNVGEVEGIPNSRKGVQRLCAHRNGRHPSRFGYVSLHSEGSSSEAGPISVWLPLMSPEPQHSTGPHVGRIGGGWKYTVGDSTPSLLSAADADGAGASRWGWRFGSVS